ncbi:MAG: CoA ester lyase [Rhodobiaceae bacterium]|nr:CoA ester lyase [Rhodobiaceae bacterium]
MQTPRSLLFVPGDRPDRFDKAVESGAGLVVLDLEDAVKPEAKDVARRYVGEWLESGGRAAIRVNGIVSPWHDDDMDLVYSPGATAIMLPKAENPSAIESLAATLPKGLSIIALIETALGVWNAAEIATIAQVSRLAFGSVDFCLDSGTGDSREALLYARSRLVLASAMARIAPPVDGVTIRPDDVDQLDSDIAHAHSLGFGGKLCIHPEQVDRVNAGFNPTAESLDWARRVVDAARGQSAGAIMLDGELIDRPVIERARRLLDQAG